MGKINLLVDLRLPSKYKLSRNVRQICFLLAYAIIRASRAMHINKFIMGTKEDGVMDKSLHNQEIVKDFTMEIY